MIIRQPRTSHYTIIPNALLEDPALDWKDIGLVVYLISKPDSWKISVEHLANQKKTGRDGIYRILNTLISCGYAKRVKRGSGSMDYFIFDEPQPLGGDDDEIHPGIKPVTENHKKAANSQILKSPNRENPDPANTTLVNTEYKQILSNLVNTERESAPAEKKQKAFTPPTAQEVGDYCEQEHLAISPSAFVDYYEANGWMVGKAKMKSWPAAVRNWARREQEHAAKQQSVYQPSFTSGIARGGRVEATGASIRNLFLR